MASSSSSGGGGGGQAAAEEPTPPPQQPPLHYQTWVLRVSIHCQGCKRKVKKVLHSIEGVYTTSVDPQQQKVIVTGNIDGQTLVRKLLKAGKHAELCAAAPVEKEKPPAQKDENSDGDDENDDNTTNPAGCNDPPHHKVMRISSPRIHGGITPGTSVRFVGFDDNRPPENATMEKPPETKGGGGGQAAGGGGGKKKKKKKKGKSKGGSGAGSGPGPGPGAANTHSNNKVGFSEMVDQINPAAGHTFDQNVYHYPPAPPQGYVVSYNAVANNPMAPSMGYYHAPMASSAAAYTHYAEGGGYPMTMMRPATPLDSFEILSDENPNGCCIM